jgi:hypothetical protein
MIGFFPSGERLPSLGAVLIDGAGFIFWVINRQPFITLVRTPE